MDQPGVEWPRQAPPGKSKRRENEAPTSNIQAPENIQTSNTNHMPASLELGRLDAWTLFSFMKSVYEFDILHTDRAADLLAFRADVLADDLLTRDEKENLCAVIGQKFARLNAAAINQHKPRW
jgi:hypothetical protein